MIENWDYVYTDASEMRYAFKGRMHKERIGEGGIVED